MTAIFPVRRIPRRPAGHPFSSGVLAYNRCPCADLEKSRCAYFISVPLFLLAVGGSCVAIFNYQKSSSPVVSSTLYALRLHNEAREVLGDEISFKYKFPWIRGELNQLHGLIDISYGVKGTKGDGVMRFRSRRPSRMALVSYYLLGFFWLLTGKV